MNVKKNNYQKSIGRWAVVFALLGALLLSGTVFAEGEVPQAPAAEVPQAPAAEVPQAPAMPQVRG